MPLFFSLNNLYSIIIPVFNEVDHIPSLIKELKFFCKTGHEVIIIDDGSNDGSYKALLNQNFLNIFRFQKNKGKGEAIKKGIFESKNEKLILFDGDFELHPKEINKLMILDSTKNIKCVFGQRNNLKKPLSFWSLGNIIFSRIFSFINKVELKDALCCAKSFFKNDILLDDLKAKKFDIDVEITTMLITKNSSFKTVNINYRRRGRIDGKKLNIVDSLSILKRMLS